MSKAPSVASKAPSVVSVHEQDEDDNEDGDELLKMRLGTSVHHSNPRSKTLLGWKNSMPLDQYRYIREHKRNQKNIPTSSSHYKEQHLIIAHRLAELEKRRVGTRYLPKGQKVEELKKAQEKEGGCIIS